MVRTFVWLIAIIGIVLAVLIYLIPIIAPAIAVLGIILAIYYAERLEKAIRLIEPETHGQTHNLLSRFQKGNINLVQAENLKLDLEVRQKEIDDRNTKIAAGVVIGGLALLAAYFLLKKKE